MKGKDSVAIAADRRFGVQAQTVSTDFQKIFEMGPRLYIGFAGLATDVQTVYDLFCFHIELNCWTSYVLLYRCLTEYVFDISQSVIDLVVGMAQW